MAAVYEIPHTWEEPEGLHDLLEKIREQRPDADLRKVRYAYYVAEELHSGQMRDSGEPYITHPLAVAHILADLHMDEDTIAAALMHDVLEDCARANPDHIEREFGRPVREMVEGVTKLKLKTPEGVSARQRARAESARAAETLRKMLLAMAKDVRVMIIKMADRLHNMRTLDGISPDRQLRIANETLDVYAPLAARLGIWQMKWQLEDLSFKHLHPKEFQEISELVAKTRGERERELTEAILVLKERLEARGLRGFEVRGRPKHLYSIFNKIVKQQFHFEEILDLIAIRVIVDTVSECYVALGIVHDLWMPIPGLFTDFIAKPKPNGYQSLHTKVVGPHGEPLELQIRTREMHEVAEFGVAAHWTYKEGGPATQKDLTKLGSLRNQLYDASDENRLSGDFLRSLTTDLFSEQVFVFTPKGDVLDLPKDSTPVDFAFRVHSDLGLTLVGAKVNGVMVALNTTLKNGDVVEIITRSNAQPSLDWLEYSRSSHAKSKLRSYFRKRNKTENAAAGRDAIERELRSAHLEPRDFLQEERLEVLAAQFGDCETGQDVLAKVGAGLIGVHNAVMKLRGLAPQRPTTTDTIEVKRTREGKLSLQAKGIEGISIRRAKCCDPIPGDELIAYVTRGRGLMLHRTVCPNAQRMLEEEAERLMRLDWPISQAVHPVHLKIITLNRQGLLMDISTILGESKTNVVAAKIRTLPNQTAEIELAVEVASTDQLQQVMSKIGNYSDVIDIYRMFGKSAGK